MVNWIGDAMVQELACLDEPTCVNQISVGGEVTVFERVRNLRFINRFGEEVVRPRRWFRYRDRGGSVAPLDVKPGTQVHRLTPSWPRSQQARTFRPCSQLVRRE